MNKPDLILLVDDDEITYFINKTILKDLFPESNVIAFRKITENVGSNKERSLCNIDFAKNVFDFINEKKNCFVLCLDVSGFFDNLDHEILKSNWSKLLQETFLNY